MMLSPRTTGAWIIGHSIKLRAVDAQGQFTHIDAAGKAGTMLSVISATQQEALTRSQVETLAQANGISMLELSTVLSLLEDRHVIQRSKTTGGIDVLGLTHFSVLEKTAEMFEELLPGEEERAVIHAAELVSDAPIRTGELRKYLSDTFQIKGSATGDLLSTAEEIGFIDAEELDATTHEKLYFNGNIFRTKDARKMQKVLDSLTSQEQAQVAQFDQMLSMRGYSTIDEARSILGPKIFEKLQAIALYDVNRVANSREEVYYVTRPGSFAKFGNPWEEDTLDYAKALVACLAYGMTRSSHGRGKIRLLTALLEKLIRGEWLNENTAAGQDYKYLELKRVVETKPGVRISGAFQMRLLKREVGVVALEVLTSGASSSEALLEKLPSSPVTAYTGPEANRASVRKKKVVAPTDRKLADILQSLRTGKQP